MVRVLFVLSLLSSLQCEKDESQKYPGLPTIYGDEKQIKGISLLDPREADGDSMNRNDEKINTEIGGYHFENDGMLLNKSKEAISTNLTKDIAKVVLTQLEQTSNTNKLMENKDDANDKIDTKELKDNTDVKELVTGQNNTFHEASEKDLLSYESTDRTTTDSNAKQNLESVSDTSKTKELPKKGESQNNKNETSNSSESNKPTNASEANMNTDDSKDNVNSIYRRESGNSTSPLDEKINKELKTTPSEYSDSSQMGPTVTGNLAAKIVVASLKEVRYRVHLNSFLGDALPKDDIALGQGTSLTDDLCKLEGDDFHTRSEKTLKQIIKSVEHLVSEEIKKNSCKMLPSELNEFLAWLVSSDENMKQPNTYTYQDNFLFHKINNKDAESKHQQKHYPEPKNCKSAKCSKCENCKKSHRTLSKNDIKFHINMAKRVLKEHSYLSEDDKIQAQSVYAKLQENINELRNLKQKGSENEVNVNSFGTINYKENSGRPMFQISTDKQNYWYSTSSPYGIPNEKDFNSKHTGENYWDQYLPVISPDKDIVFATSKTNDDDYQYLSTSRYDDKYQYYYVPGANIKLNKEYTSKPAGEKTYRYVVMSEENNYDTPSGYENLENSAMSKSGRSVEKFALAKGNTGDTAKSTIIQNQLKFGLDPTNLRSPKSSNGIGAEYEPTK